MTTLIATPTLSAPPVRTRVWNVVRLHLVNRWNYLGIFWVILVGSWAVSLIIAALINFASDGTADLGGMRYSWAVISPIWYLAAVAIMAISQTFPFALGFGVTRTDFYLGTSLLFVLLSLGNALALATLVEIEKATTGWGLGAHMFDALFFSDATWIQNVFLFAVIQLGICFIGAWIATIYMRWRVAGMLWLWLGLAALLVIVLSAITLLGEWGAVAGWFVAQGTMGLFAWLALLVALAAVSGFVVLRKATPKN